MFRCLFISSLALVLSFRPSATNWQRWWGNPLEDQGMMEWIQNLSSLEVYCKLVQVNCSLSCDECSEQKKQLVLDEAKAKILSLKSQALPKTRPFAIFVLGGVGAGKSSLIRNLDKELSQGFSASAFHVDADELRSELIGGYAIYSAMSNNNRRDPKLIKAANELRLKIQSFALQQQVNFVADSLSIPLFVPAEFQDKGYDVRIFLVEIPGETLEEKVAKAEQRVQHRVEKGGHFAIATPEQIQESREAAENCTRAGFSVKKYVSSEVGLVPMKLME